MADNPRRLLLRVTLKLLTLGAILIIAIALLNGGEIGEEAPHPQPVLQIELSTLRYAKPQRTEWAGGPLQLLRMAEQGRPYLFYDRGGNLGCPLAWQPPGITDAPQQPWPGGFRDQCNSTWYRYDGKVLAGQSSSRDLQSPPHRLIDGHLLLIGVNGDNATPP